VKGHLTKRTIFGEEASNGFPIDFRRREMNETLVVFGTVLDLNQNSNSQSSIPIFTIKKTERETHHMVSRVNGLKQRQNCEGKKLKGSNN